MTSYEINKLIHEAKEGDIITINEPVEMEAGQYICAKKGVTVVFNCGFPVVQIFAPDVLPKLKTRSPKPSWWGK